VPDLAARGGGGARARAAEQVEREIERGWSALGARYLFLGQGLYPPLLAELETAPPLLIVKGTSPARAARVAMVGARNASAAACRFARQLAQGSGRARARWWSPASPAASTARRMTARWRAARSA
jgi:DNA processing protein